VTRPGRVLAVLGLCAATFSGLSSLGAPAASAHPLGNFTVNVYSGVELSPGAIRIRHVIDMAEIPTFQEGPTIDANGDGTESAAERQAWADRKSAEVLTGLTLKVDGRLLPLSLAGTSLELLSGQAGLPTLRLEATYTASLEEAGTIAYQDGNYADRLGWKEVTVRSTSGVAIVSSTVPANSASQELRAYPSDLLANPLDVRGARFTFRPGVASVPSMNAGTGRPSGTAADRGGSFAALVNWRLTPLILVLSLFAAFLFGVIHALSPGHGKTITAAYLVGTEAPVRTAVAAGLAVSFMHIVSIVALGVVALILFRSIAAELVYSWLGLITGVAALGLGLVLLRSRMRARVGESHRHPHEHRHGLAALALAGGMLPSPTALVVLTGAISYQRVAYGLALIVAFSLGLAAALILVGILALRARSSMAGRFHGRWVELVPLASAAAIAAVGAFLVLRGIAQIS
jgi:nickel/cobalt exporter